jgi:hypothetical protein
MADLNPLWDFFHRGVKQNQAHWKTYCKGCVKKHMEDAGSPMTDIITRGQSYLDGTARFIEIFHHSFYPACTAVGHVISVKSSWIAHILGGKTACPNASVEAKAEATAQRKETSDAKELKKHPRSATPDPTEPLPKKHQTQSKLVTYRRNDMPFGAPEIAAVQRQALRAIVSGGLPLGAFREPEMLILFSMFRSTAPEVMPTGKVIGGRLLNEAAEEVEVRIENALKDKDAGMS